VIEQAKLENLEFGLEATERYVNAMRLADPLYYTTPNGLQRMLRQHREQIIEFEAYLKGIYGREIA